MFKLQLSKKSQKFLSNLPHKQQNQLVLKILELKKQGHTADSAPLKGSDWFRTDAGEYRIIYMIESPDILVIPLIGKRNDDEIYKKFRRLHKN